MIRYIILFLCIFVTINAQKNDVFFVARSGTLQEMKDLVKINPDTINTVSEMGFTPLILACYRGNKEVAKYLIDQVKNVDYNSPEGTALAALCINYDRDLMEYLLKRNANPNIKDSRGNTPLLWAIKRENPEMLKLLLQYGADKNVKDEQGITAFENALQTNNQTLINILKSE